MGCYLKYFFAELLGDSIFIDCQIINRNGDQLRAKP
jgi:hypothetical protein